MRVNCGNIFYLGLYIMLALGLHFCSPPYDNDKQFSILKVISKCATNSSVITQNNRFMGSDKSECLEWRDDGKYL